MGVVYIAGFSGEELECSCSNIIVHDGLSCSSLFTAYNLLSILR